jgi:hypothetical protein
MGSERRTHRRAKSTSPVPYTVGMSGRIFILSPARCDGERAEMVLSPRASFPLARRLREQAGAPLGEVMSFLSGLYFRGKLTYAQAFARPSHDGDGVFVITSDSGLRPPAMPVTATSLRRAARCDIDARNERYRRPLEASARKLAAILSPADEVVLLGSIASPKYVDVLTSVFGDRLLFPLEFVGRGDMSRGGLLLRCVTAGNELSYVPVRGAVRSGPRPPKLTPLRGARP